MLQEVYRYSVSGTNGIKTLTEEDLSHYFGRFGKLKDVFVCESTHHKDDEGKQKRYAFVKFDFLSPLNGDQIAGRHNIDGVKVMVERARDDRVIKVF